MHWSSSPGSHRSRLRIHRCGQFYLSNWLRTLSALLYLILALRPAFVALLHMREFFTTTGMSDMHDKVKELIKHGFNKNNITKHDILPEDGFEMEAGTKVRRQLHTTTALQRSSLLDFGSCIGEDRENSDFYPSKFRRAHQRLRQIRCRVSRSHRGLRRWRTI